MDGRTIRHESELGSWELVVRRPDPRLRPLVTEYEGYVEEGATPPVVRQELPSTLVPVIINLGAPWRIGDDASVAPAMAHDSFVAGLTERSVYVGAEGSAACVQLNFTPLGAHVFLGLPMHELTGRVVALEDVLPRGTHSLAGRIEAASDWDERFTILDAVLLRRFADARPPDPEVAWAWHALERSHGRVRIAALAERTGRSRRHLGARFREHVGVPPKTMARIFRFRRAFALIQRRPELALTEVALECGYSDQPHMNREFREFARSSPADVARRIVPDGGLLA